MQNVKHTRGATIRWTGRRLDDGVAQPLTGVQVSAGIEFDKACGGLYVPVTVIPVLGGEGGDYFVLSVPAGEQAEWPIGPAKMDVRFEWTDELGLTVDFTEVVSISVVRSVTRANPA